MPKLLHIAQDMRIVLVKDLRVRYCYEMIHGETCQAVALSRTVVAEIEYEMPRRKGRAKACASCLEESALLVAISLLQSWSNLQSNLHTAFRWNGCVLSVCKCRM